MTRYYEEHQSRRRHDSTVGILVATACAVVYVAFRPDWFGVAPNTATYWFWRLVALTVVVCAAGCVYRALKNRRSKTERELGLPPTSADTPQRLPRER